MKEKITISRLRFRYENNIKIVIKEVGWKVVSRSDPSQYID